MTVGNLQEEWIFVQSGVTTFVLHPLFDKLYGEEKWKVRGDRLYVHVSVAPVRKFPYDFPETPHKTEIEIVASFSELKVTEACRALNGSRPEDWQYISFKFNQCDYFVAARGMQLVQEPHKSRSSIKGSRALYYGTCAGDAQSYLLQYLPPHSPTSSHYHDEIVETFCLVEGSVLISVGGRTYTVLPTNSVTAAPRAAHSLLTEELPSLTLIVMDGSTKGLSSDDHHYLDNDIRSLGCPRLL